MWLTLSEAAELEKISNRGIRMAIVRGKYEVKKVNTEGKCGFEYRVALDSLSKSARLRAYRKYQMDSKPKEDSKINENELDFECLSQEQKEKVLLMESMLLAWRGSIEDYESKKAATELFLREWNDNYNMEISERSLYRKWNRYKQMGKMGLVDKRELREKCGSQIPEEAWDIFKWWYLDINQNTVAFTYKMLCAHYKAVHPEVMLPSETTFRRQVKEIPRPVVEYYRHGKKDWKDKCAYFLRRDYESIYSNQFWTSDYHTLDLFVLDDVTGEVFRPHVVVWTDIRSRKILALRLMRSSNSDGVFLTFRDAVQNFGFCENIYVDNGREFLVSDFGGRGRRKKSVTADYGISLLERLGIRMVNAEVANGRAKVCERQFETMSNQFSRLYKTYCGNSPDNRPEGLEHKLKEIKNIPLLSKIEEELRVYVEGMYNNEPSKAEGLGGLSPNECYQKNLIAKKVATKAELSLLMLRTTKAQQYKRNGVYLQFGSIKLYYYDANLTTDLLGKKVYMRYDPEHLDTVNLEDEEGRYLATIGKAVTGGYNLEKDTESIRELKKINKKLEKIVKEYKETSLDNIPVLSDVLKAEAERRRAECDIDYQADILEPISFKLEKAAVGQDFEPINLDKMIRNARKNKEE